MASSDGTQTSPAENFNIQGIIDAIDLLLKRLPEGEHSATQPTPDNNSNSVNDGNLNNSNKDLPSSNTSSINGSYSNQNKEVNEDKNGENGSDQDPCAWIWALLNYCRSTENENNLEAKDSISRSSSNQSLLEKIRKTLNQVKVALKELKKLEEGELGKRVQPHLRHVEAILEGKTLTPIGSLSSIQTQAKLREISKEIMKIKNQIPSLLKLSSTGSGSYNNSETKKDFNACSAFHGQLNPHNSTSFLSSSFYDEIKEIYQGLRNDAEKIFFLSCFSVLPENAVVKRRLLTYWWVGEGLVNDSETGEKTPEKCVDRILEDFMKKGLIEPAKKERKGRVKSYRMHPLVRSAVIKLSEKKFFAYDDDGNLTANLSETNRACLGKAKEASSILQRQNLDQEKLLTLFNVSETFPDLELQLLAKMKNVSVVEWLSKMKKVKVLYLGRWQKSATYHIEVESIEFLKGLKSMKELRLLSLQGISRINELPSSIGKLRNLMILDVKACHNLEVLPEEISQLKNLRYLDVSDCYLLDRMPRGLSSLSELQVLKGFVIGNPQSGSSGTIDDLKELKKLRKLTISASSEDFPARKDLLALEQLGAQGVLRKLTIAWGSKQGIVAPKPAKAATIKRIFSKQRTMRDPGIAVLPEKLEKLDLQCFPKPKTPHWLVPDKLKSLKKLYIRGGGLRTLEKDEWTSVETLCLKYLSDLKIDWKELQERFPKLRYLEKVKCPRITFCPCDEDGVWVTN